MSFFRRADRSICAAAVRQGELNPRRFQPLHQGESTGGMEPPVTLRTGCDGLASFGPHRPACLDRDRAGRARGCRPGRAGTFEPVIVPERCRRLNGVDALVCLLSAKGLTHGEICAHLAEIYGRQVSEETITRVTDPVLEGGRAARWSGYLGRGAKPRDKAGGPVAEAVEERGWPRGEHGRPDTSRTQCPDLACQAGSTVGAK
jgi:hypothetical protein